MNRDERFTRERALRPEEFRLGELAIVYPRERSGGTWVAANTAGVACALLNRNATKPFPKVRSRGEIIPQLCREVDLTGVAASTAQIEIDGMLPFTLLCFSLRERLGLEFQWSGESLRWTYIPWQTGHWYSSGLSDEDAAAKRSEATAAATKLPRAGSLPWLRELHRSHAPERGAFSICAHRPDGGTVSYSEALVRAGRVAFRYHEGSPCEPAESIRLVSSRH